MAEAVGDQDGADYDLEGQRQYLDGRLIGNGLADRVRKQHHHADLADNADGSNDRVDRKGQVDDDLGNIAEEA